jgi:hypothetical protein
MSVFRRLLLLPLAVLATSSCAGLVANLAADALSGEGNAYRADDDPELVREAIPSGLKVIESLLEGSPDNSRLLAAAASGFTQYAYAYVQQDADEIEPTDLARAREMRARAKKLFRRAVGYGFHGLASEWGSGFSEAFTKDRVAALKKIGKDDVPLLYWTGAALAAWISLSKDDMQLIGRLPEVEALMARALELDESFSDGAIHEFYITYDATVGGNVARARQRYDRVIALTHDRKIGPLVTWAEVVAVQAQDRKLFDQLLDKVLGFDVDIEPRFRLVNLIAQRRARFLKARAGDLFLEE